MITEHRKPWGARLVLLAAIMMIIGGFVSIYSDVSRKKKLPLLSGMWTMTFKTDDTAYAASVNDISVYDIYVSQPENGALLAGTGEQTLYNGNIAREYAKIQFKNAEIRGDHVEIGYSLMGAVTAEGRMNLSVDPYNHGHLTGSFTNDTGDVKGMVEIVIKP